MRFCSSFSVNGTRIFWGLMSSALGVKEDFGVGILGRKREMGWIEGRTAMNWKILFLQDEVLLQLGSLKGLWEGFSKLKRFLYDVW